MVRTLHRCMQNDINGRMAASGSKDRSIKSWVPVGAF